MALTLPDDLSLQLEHIARQQNRDPADFLRDLLQVYITESQEVDPLGKLLGIYKDDVEDMSSTVRQTLAEYYRKKYESSD